MFVQFNGQKGVYNYFLSYMHTCSSIRPTSGHIQGGTVVTITGTDLGMIAEDVLLVSIGNSPCIVQNLLYIPGMYIISTCMFWSVILVVHYVFVGL